MRLIAILLLVLSSVAEAAKGGKAPAPAAPVASNGFTRGGAGRMQDPRTAPPLDPSRRVNEQDCSKPIDLSAGNLKCK